MSHTDLRFAQGKVPATPLTPYGTPEGIKQYNLDLIASIIIIQGGFVSHPKFNTMAQVADPQEYYNLVRDEFRQINTYIVERCIIDALLHPTERYNHRSVRVMLIEYGYSYAEHVFEQKKLPSWDEAKKLFDDLVTKHFNIK